MRYYIYDMPPSVYGVIKAICRSGCNATMYASSINFCVYCGKRLERTDIVRE